jgi:O-antigen/teichoic acid export membrane protein
MSSSTTSGPGTNGPQSRDERRGAKRPVGGSGAVLGVQVLRHWSIYSVGSFLMIVLSLASVLVIAYELGKADLGQFGLLIFFAGLINLFYNLGSRSGTYKVVYGGDDEDDDDDEEDEDIVPEETRRALGTGILLTALVATVGTLVMLPFLPELAQLLLGDSGETTLILWAALVGAFGALWKIIAQVERLERRPVSNVVLNIARPILILGGVIALVATGYGLEGAIAGMAIGTAVSVALGLWVIRDSWQFGFDPAMTGQIMRRGSHRIPIIISMWTLQNADTFILSRYVSHSDLGLYQLASKTGMVVAFFPAAFFQAWRPIKRTSVFAAVEAEYGVGEARGTMLTYFGLLFITVLLGIAMLAEVLVEAAPPAYASAATLIPLVSAGLMAPVAFRSINKAAKFPGKKWHYVFSVVGAALLFIGSSMVLIPLIGLAGAPVAMMIGFGVSGSILLIRSQRGPTPISLPVRQLGTAALLAVLTAVAFDLVSPESKLLQALLAVGLLAIYVAGLIVVGPVPRRHRRPLLQMGRTLFGRGGDGVDSEAALIALPERDRIALRMAAAERLPIDEVAQALAEDRAATAERTVRALRELSELTGHAAGDVGERDAQIGEYLFLAGTVAQRDLVGKQLRAGGVEPHDLHALELTLAHLRKLDPGVWPDEPLPRPRTAASSRA